MRFRCLYEHLFMLTRQSIQACMQISIGEVTQ